MAVTGVDSPHNLCVSVASLMLKFRCSRVQQSECGMLSMARKPSVKAAPTETVARVSSKPSRGASLAAVAFTPAGTAAPSILGPERDSFVNNLERRGTSYTF